MPQIKLVVCRQGCVVCWSDVLVKNEEMSVYFPLQRHFPMCFKACKDK